MAAARRGRPANKSGGQAPAITPVEVKRLLAVCRADPKFGLRNACLVSICLSGARVSEPLVLTVGAVSNGVGGIHQSFVLPASNSKNRKPRRIYLSGTAQRLLGEYLQQLGASRLDPETLLFPIAKNYATRLVNSLMKDAGISSTSHGLRRGAATELCERGVSIRTLQEVLGHTNISSTNYYLQASGANVAKAMGVLPW